MVKGQVKVFISWSGKVSHEIASFLRDWLPKAHPNIDPWVSSEDIDKGKRGRVELSARLKESNFGILCLLPQNANEPWVIFEAGALSNAFGGQVSPLLMGLSLEEIPEPLRQFQCTQFKGNEVNKLIHSINRVLNAEEQINKEKLDQMFEACWPSLEEKVSPFLSKTENYKKTQIEKDQKSKKNLALTVLHINILKEICKSQIGAMNQDIAINLNIHNEKIRLSAEQLVAEKFINEQHFTTGNIRYTLQLKGREYLMKEGHLENPNE